jgi:hypothetical protein
VFAALNLSGPLTSAGPRVSAAPAPDADRRNDAERPRVSAANPSLPVANSVPAELVASAAKLSGRPPSVPPPENPPAE